MSKRNLRQFWSKYQAWFYRAVLIIIILLLLSVGIRPASLQNQSATTASFDNFYNLADRKPQDSDFYIGPDENQQVLDETLQKIFPEGTEKLSDEGKAIEIERFAVTYFKNKNNGGTATKIINDGYSICGGVSYVFRILLRTLNVPTRYVGMFYAPKQGGHVLAEVYYDDSWHLFDPTFGVFVYSQPSYDKNGYILSMEELRKNTQEGYIQQVSASSKVWSGEYAQDLKNFGVKALDDDYLIEHYGQKFNDYWRNEVANSFPIAYGENSWVSVPVDIDLKDKDYQAIGEKNKDSNDTAIHENRFEGTNYIGITRNEPNVYNTFAIKINPPQTVILKYYVIGKIYDFKIIPLRSVNLQNISREKDGIRIELKIIDDLGIFMALVPFGSMEIDAIEVFKE